MKEVEIVECRAEDVDEAIKHLWMDNIREGSISALPTEENAEKWVKFAHSGLAMGRDLLLVAKTENRIV